MSYPTDVFPKTKTQAVRLLFAAAERIVTRGHSDISGTNYDDRKASQLLEILGDILMSEAKLDAWKVDLSETGAGECCAYSR